MFLEWGLVGLFIVCFLSATLLPFPSEAAVFFLLNNHLYADASILVVASIGNCLGGCTTFYIGYWANRLIKKVHYFSKMERLTYRYGSWMALISWLPFIGDPILTLLGVLKSKPIPTLILMIIGKTGRYLTLYWIYVLSI